MMLSIKISTSAILAIITLAAVGATSCGGAAEESDFQGPSVQFVVPSDTMTDWVSFAKQVSVVTVIREEQMEVPPEVNERREGHIPGTLTLWIEDTLWTAPGVLPQEGQIQVGSLGWTMHEGKLRPINPEVEPGGTYLVALADFKTGLAPMRPLSIRIANNRVAANSEAARSYSGAWVASLDGMTLEQVEAAFAAESPDKLASQYAGLTVEAQVEAVRRARASNPP